MKYEVYIEQKCFAKTIKTFDSKEKAINFVKKYCDWSGVNWLIRDTTTFPYLVTSRVVGIEEV